ncbi:MAG: glycosyltransferase family 4 protein, partial [Spirochaetales bacterium]|nr:glycosyltransferase family 4 protein [Spirochaetales bacterium]
HNIMKILKYSLIWRVKKNIKIFHFNWLLSLLNKKTLNNYYLSFILFLWLIVLKCLGCKIIWTVHNRLPHDCRNKNLVILFRKFLIIISNRIIIHSHSTRQFISTIIHNKSIDKKIIYIPHGNYINIYKNSGNNKRKQLKIEENTFVFLHIGLIKPYKNIDLLMNAFSSLALPNSKLLIAGHAVSPSYQKYLENIAAKLDNIIYIPKFIPDDELGEFINSGDVILLPYAKESFINSGNLYLSLSFAKPVIIPDIGIAQDFYIHDFIFKYTYLDNNDHFTNLKTMINSVYIKYSQNKNELHLLGQKGYEYIKKYNDWNHVGKKLYEVYKSTLSR